MSLAEAMSDHVDTRFISFGPSRRSFLQGKLRVEVYPIRGAVDGNFLSPISYAFLAEFLRADVIHCHQYKTTVTNQAILVGAVLGKGVYVTDHGGEGYSLDNRLPLINFVDGYLAESAFSEKVLPRFKRMQLIYGGVSKRFAEDGGRIRDARERRVLYVGRLIPSKGINYLIEAIDDNVCLDIVGRPYDERYFVQLQALARNKQVQFITDATDDDIFQAHSRATVTVLPSVYDDVYGEYHVAPELLGLALLESMACGTPVICTDVGSMPEIVEDGVSGFVVPPNDPAALRERINYLLQNPAVAREMGHNARQRVLQKFTWQASAERCLAAYNDY